MDVPVANLSNGQKQIAKFEEKGKNKLQLVGKNALCFATMVGSGAILSTSLDAKDTIELCRKNGTKPTGTTRFLAGVADSLGYFYENISNTFKNSGLKEKLSDLAENFKDATKNEKGVVMAMVALCLATTGAMVRAIIKHTEKDAQIEQKYN